MLPRAQKERLVPVYWSLLRDLGSTGSRRGQERQGVQKQARGSRRGRSGQDLLSAWIIPILRISPLLWMMSAVHVAACWIH